MMRRQTPQANRLRRTRPWSEAQAALETANAGTDQAAKDAATAAVAAAQATVDAEKGVKAAFERTLNDALKAVGYPVAGVENTTVAVAQNVIDVFTARSSRWWRS